MKNTYQKLKDGVFGAFFILTGVWIAFALCFQVYGLFLVATDQEDKMTQISNEISWRIDGTFKDNPENIWYKK
jgi:hypothetical protein